MDYVKCIIGYWYKIKRNSKGQPASPSLFISNITFNDDTCLQLYQNSIVVFVGANNHGKSQVLKDIEHLIRNTKNGSVIVRSMDSVCTGNIDEKFLIEKARSSGNGNYYIDYNSQSVSAWQENWKEKKLEELSLLFMNRLDTKDRLTVSATKQLRTGSRHETVTALHELYDDYDKEELISDYFFSAFNEKLVVNRRAGQNVALHTGKAPDRSTLTLNDEALYYNNVAKLPALESQGDGMRSFASVLLDNFTTDKTITLIDEPEAFLHPPHARLMGKMLASHNPNTRQLFIATHSIDFLQGLLDTTNNNVTVVRIKRVDNINHIRILNNETIQVLWKNPIFRYSKILDGIFHEKVVVCEGDYDCLFYQAIIDAKCEDKSGISPDLLFVNCGGKDRIKDAVKALKALDVPVIAITDIDVLNDKRKFKLLYESFGVQWDDLIENKISIIYNHINAHKSKEVVWKAIKNAGVSWFSGEAPAAFESIEKKCQKIGLFILSVGELECFDKTVGSKREKEWVYHILENYELASECKLRNAREFVERILLFNAIGANQQ